MSAVINVDGSDTVGNLNGLNGSFTSTVGPKRERQMLEELVECKRTLAEAMAHEPGVVVPGVAEGPGAMSRFVTEIYAELGSVLGGLEAVFRRYFEVRAELALANMRLVAHVAKRYRNRGISYPDLIQEGFCGLLQAIDRFDLARETKLATYATWWIRQSVQSAVAAGAHPVRLTPRHLRQLAQDQEQHDRQVAPELGPHPVAAESIHRIRVATRPAVSLDESRGETDFRFIQAMSDTARNRADDIDLDEAVGKSMEALRPRQRQVLSYRFGLGGSPRLSLSKVGEVMGVSKERVRQIQEVALKELRSKLSRDIPIDANHVPA